MKTCNKIIKNTRKILSFHSFNVANNKANKDLFQHQFFIFCLMEKSRVWGKKMLNNRKNQGKIAFLFDPQFFIWNLTCKKEKKLSENTQKSNFLPFNYTKLSFFFLFNWKKFPLAQFFFSEKLKKKTKAK